MALNFRGANPELHTLCHYQFPRLQDNCSRFATIPSTTPNDAATYLENEFDGEEEDDIFFESLEKKPSKRHVFANVWERSLDPRGGSCDVNSITDTWTIDFRQWPPDVPKISQGVKIPVDLIPNQHLRVMEATPLSSGSGEFYHSLKGLFNPCQTASIQVNPPALLFLKSRVGQFYSVKLSLKNVDIVPHRVKIVPPKNQSFNVAWTTRVTSIVPGLSVPILVQYKPRNNASLNEILFIAVEGAGGLTVPLVACSEAPPILEFDEWNCGCSVLQFAKTNSFSIKNVGSEGRFWFLTEDEFRYQYITYPKRPLEEPEGKGGATQNRMGSISPGGIIQLIAGPFSINTACFKLLRNQRVKIEVKYTPKTTGFHYEKLAVMCDNGEVRWIAIKGIGIDLHSKGLVDLRVETYWTAPPVDLPFDEKCLYSLDFADLLPGDVGTANFRAVNKSCIAMYYFWSVRPLITGFGVGGQSTTEGNHGRICFSRFPEGTLQPSDGSDVIPDHHHNHHHKKAKEVVDLSVVPAQGILRQRQAADFSISAPCPQEIGYYACVMSLFIEQLEESSVPAICKFIKGLENTGMNNVPIHLDFLKESLTNTRIPPQKTLRPPPPPREDDPSVYLEEEYDEEDEYEEEEDQGIEFIMQPRKRKPSHPCPPAVTARIHSSDETSGDTMDEDQNMINAAFGKAPYRPKNWKNSKNVNVLQPIVEIEVWLRSMPLEVKFSPPFIVATGVINSRVERIITVTNESQWPILLKLDQLMDTTGTICCEPHTLTIQPSELANFTAVICLKNHGKVLQPLCGTMNVLDSTMIVPISIHCSITSQGPYITTLTPLIHFGFTQVGCEKMKTIAIKNMGDRPARWEAFVNAQDLIDDEGHNLTPYNCNIHGMKLLRVWPTWGVLEPQEIMGINVYLSAEIEGDFAASITISVQDVPDSVIIIPVIGVVQRPFLYLEESEISLCEESLQKNRVEDCSATLINPTGFPITFVWQPCLIGRDSQNLSVEFCPGTAFVPPRGTLDVVLSISSDSDFIDLRHVYAVCMVDGMKEPLILKISAEWNN